MSANSARMVWAVGEVNGPPLLARWNGTKWIRTVPHTDWFLESVAALRPGDAWAVGFRGEPDSQRPVYTLIRHWDGRRWEYVPSPNPRFENRLFRVSAINAHDVWALGDTEGGGSGWAPLIIHFDGARWTKVRFPAAPAGDAFRIGGLSAASATDVWLAGEHYYGATGTTTLLTAHWDGAKWTLIPGPAPKNAATTFHLQSITAISSTDAWAVGDAETVRLDGTLRLRTLTLHWDGTTWTRVVSPNQASRYARLWDVTAVSANDVWAVGRYRLSHGRSLALTLHWNGTGWSAVPTPNPGYSDLVAVSAASSTDVWAVGRLRKTISRGETYGLALHWNGLRWQQRSSP